MEVVHTMQAFGKVKGIVGHAAVVLDWSESRWFGRLKKNVQKGGYVESLPEVPCSTKNLESGLEKFEHEKF